ncbi:MAG: glycoside hydrolase N-terminal domain-containing protein [Cellulosilyticaceae bacterium]
MIYKARSTIFLEEMAAEWNEAFPIGNGALGGMVFSSYPQDKVQLNMDTLWSGYGRDKKNKAPDHEWDKIRKSILEKDYKLAEEKLKNKVLGDWTESYMPMADLVLDYHGIGRISHYYRLLDLETGVVKSGYKWNGDTFTMSVFCSNEDECMVIQLASDSDILDVSLALESKLKHLPILGEINTIGIEGIAPSSVQPNYYECDNPVVYDEHEGTRFICKVYVSHVEGTMQKENNVLRIQDARVIEIKIVACTDFEKEIEFNLQEVVSSMMDKVKTMNYKQIFIRHAKEYQKYFARTELELGETYTETTTVERLKRFEQGEDDQALVALVFNYGRYLLISSSRPGTLPANLQGIWNAAIRAPWSSNYTLNINTQMNYWLAEKCNLSECHEPLLEYIKKLSIKGAETAKNLYGCKGWVVHHNSDIWGHTTPVGRKAKDTTPCQYGYWPMAAGWLAMHLWEHYLYTEDTVFAQEQAYPVLKGAAEFYVDYLQQYGDYLVTMPSTSPENTFKDADGKVHAVTIGSTMDITIIKEVFHAVITLGKLFNKDETLLQTVMACYQKLPPYQIGHYGQLQEWLEDHEEVDQNHRHLSHLYGVFPGCTLLQTGDETIRAACKKTLETRGNEGPGWSCAWKVNLWARLCEGEKAFTLIKQQLKLVTTDNVAYTGGGTYKNLLCAHPPFQIDGNLGITSGITEMLLQSYDSTIHLLPAIPKAWHTGSIKGIKALGNLIVSFEWKNHTIIYLKMVSQKDKVVKVRLNGRTVSVTCKENEPIELFL